VEQTRRFPRLIAIAAALALSLLFAGPARAGMYQAYECYPSASPNAMDALYSETDGDFAATDTSCPGSSDYVGTSSSSSKPIGSGRNARWHLYAPSGTTILPGSYAYANIRESGGLKGTLYAVPAGSGSSDPYWSDGSGGDTGGSFHKFTLQYTKPTYSQVLFELRCASSSSCAASSYLRLNRMVVRLSDTAAPAINSFAGPFDGAFHGGTQTVTYAGHDDGSGIRRAEVKVNGAVAPSVTYADCAISSGNLAQRLAPCAHDRNGSIGILPSALQDGENKVELCVHDFENLTSNENVTCSGERTLLYDGSPPSNPEGLTVADGDGWHTQNGFDLSWRNEGQGAAAPLARAKYRVSGPGGYDSGVLFGPAGDIDHLDDIKVPAPGDYVIKVWLEDAAGNSDPANSESVHLRFDDVAPPVATAAAPRGWISRAELPYTQTWAAIPSGGSPASGIKGYAVLLDESSSGDPCLSTTTCTDAETNFKGATSNSMRVQSLTEGLHWVHVAAVSGAGLKSEVSTVQLKVDKTNPESALHGVPEGWINQAVALSVSATDGLSGMSGTAGDDGRPGTAIRVDGGSGQFAGSPTDVTAGISAEGDHTVRFWAIDLAGNANDGQPVSQPGDNEPGSAHVRIDRTAPSVAFANSQDPEDLELIRAPVADQLSGVRDGEIAFRRAGSSDAYVGMATVLREGRLESRFPSDSQPEGAYEFKATARDAAGNSQTTGSRQNGQAMILTNPIKLPTALRATWDSPAAHAICRLRRSHNPRLRRRYRAAYRRCIRNRTLAQTHSTVGYGAPASVQGTLTDGGGTALGSQPVRIVEQFDAGATVPDRTTTVQTDSAGHFGASLAPGPSRTVIARFDGTKTYAAAQAGQIRENVLTQVTFTASPSRIHNGQTVQFSGAVGMRDAAPPSDGKLLEIQFYDTLRRKWRVVELTESRPDGSFAASYRFRTITIAQRFKFRAFARRQSEWPYAAAASPARRITVYP
jgi:hypothetical protein